MNFYPTAFKFQLNINILVTAYIKFTQIIVHGSKCVLDAYYGN